MFLYICGVINLKLNEMIKYTGITISTLLAYIFLITYIAIFYQNAKVSEIPFWFWLVSLIFAINFVVWVFFSINQLLK